MLTSNERAGYSHKIPVNTLQKGQLCQFKFAVRALPIKEENVRGRTKRQGRMLKLHLDTVIAFEDNTLIVRVILSGCRSSTDLLSGT